MSKKEKAEIDKIAKFIQRVEKFIVLLDAPVLKVRAIPENGFIKFWSSRFDEDDVHLVLKFDAEGAVRICSGMKLDFAEMLRSFRFDPKSTENDETAFGLADRLVSFANLYFDSFRLVRVN